MNSNSQQFQENLKHIKKKVNRSREDFISNHFAKYNEPKYPPVWKTLEIVTFGTLSKLFMNLSDTHIKKQIAYDFNLPQHIYMESWMKSIAVLRNYIAHHARIWNRRFPLSPQLPKRLPMAWVDISTTKRFKFYSLLCCLVYLQNTIHPNNDFKLKLKNLLEAYPHVETKAMGFPNNWMDEKLWK